MSWGQGVLGGGMNGPGRFIEPPRDVTQLLREAEDALAEERWADAVLALGKLTEGGEINDGRTSPKTQDYLIAPEVKKQPSTPGFNPRFTPPQIFRQAITDTLWRKLRKMIGDLPAEAKEYYSLRYDAKATADLNAATQARDWNAIGDVRRNYFHTPAGYEASYLLALRYWYRGEPLATQMLLSDVTTNSRAIEVVGENVLALHAAACVLSDRELPGHLEDVAKQLAMERDNVDLASVSSGDGDYWHLGDKPSRSTSSVAELPLANVRWQLPTTASPRQRDMVQQIEENMQSRAQYSLPSLMPLKVGDHLVMRTTERLVGVDHRTGKRVWTYPWQTGKTSLDPNELRFDSMEDRDDVSQHLLSRIWHDIPYASISSDGERVYMLTDLSRLESANFSPMQAFALGRRPRGSSGNTLVALELDTEGKLVWRLGQDARRDQDEEMLLRGPSFGADANDRSIEDSQSNRLDEAFFLGPPLAIEGRLYVIAELASDITLLCLEPATGELIWEQTLVALETGGIAVDGVRRLAGAVPTYHEGVLICPTGAGATVSVHLDDRTLAWGVQYSRDGELARASSMRGVRSEFVFNRRWHNGAAIASDGVAIVTPIETNSLFAWRVDDGAIAFPAKSREGWRYVLGVQDELFLLVADSQVEAFSLVDGKSRWTASSDVVPRGESICGLGAMGDGQVVLPTSANELIVLSLEDGSELDRRTVQFPLGNLVAVRGELISQSPQALSVSYGVASLKPEVKRMLEENPDGLEGILRKSELLIHGGDLDEALRWLDRARDVSPGNIDAQVLSVDAMLGLYRRDPNAAQQYVDDLEVLIDRPEQRVEFLRLQVDKAFQDEDLLTATEILVELSGLVASEGIEAASIDVVEGGWTAGADSSLASHFRQLKDEVEEVGDSGLYEQIENRLIDHQERLGDRAPEVLLSLARHLDAWPCGHRVRGELQEFFLSDQRCMEAERLLWGARLPGNYDTLDTERILLLAEVYARADMIDDAKEALFAYRSRDSKSANEVADALQELMEESGRKSLKLSGQGFTPELLHGEVFARWLPPQPTRNTRFNPTRYATTVPSFGKAFRDHDLLSRNSIPMMLRNPDGTLQVLNHDVSIDGGHEAIINGTTMLAKMPNSLVCVDLHQSTIGRGDYVRWWRPLDLGRAAGSLGTGRSVVPRSKESTPFGDAIYRSKYQVSMDHRAQQWMTLGPVLGDRMFLLSSGDLLAIDVVSQTVLWRNSEAPDTGLITVDGDQVAVVSAGSEPEVLAFSVDDGEVLQRRPWQSGKLWTAQGASVLSYQRLDIDPAEDESYRYEILITNPITGEILERLESFSEARSRSVTKSAYADVVDGRYFVWGQSTGEVMIWDLLAGKALFKEKLAANEDLRGLKAFRMSNRMVLLTDGIKPPLDPENPISIDVDSAVLHEPAYEIVNIDLDQGRVVWRREFEDQWGCTTTHPSASPALMLTRVKTLSATTLRRQSKKLDFQAISMIDGRTIYESLDRSVANTTKRCGTNTVVMPVEQMLSTSIGFSLELNLEFGETAQASLTAEKRAADATGREDPKPGEVVEERSLEFDE
ncbi:MAG: PQQ-binding-like beta-propeller repeat protein [Planctomycetota bacterium]